MKSQPAKKAAKKPTVKTKQKPGPKSSDLTIRVAFRATPEEHVDMTLRAQAQRRTVSNFLREIYIEYTKQNPPPE